MFQIKRVMVQLDDLVTQILSDQKKRIHNENEQSLVFSILNTTAAVQGKSTTGLNGQFLYVQLLFNCLVRMQSSSSDKNELVSLCKAQYKNNYTELKNIHDFEKNYSADRALNWYTRPTFLYQVLNQAFLAQNIDLLFLFRFSIRDLRHQLEQYRCLSRVRIYRGQLMSNDEVRSLQDAVGEFISINSFFSTTMNRDVALFFLGDCEVFNNLQRVLFEIDADPHLNGIKPFANISSVSHCPDEQEVLVMIGSIFRLISIHLDGNQLFIVRLIMCSDNDHDLKTISDHMTNEYFGAGETSLGQFGNVLRSMGKFDDVERYYCRLLKELPSDHQDTAGCYWGLGIVAFNKGQYDSSLKYHRRALNIFQQTLQPNNRHLGDSSNCIGSVYESKRKFRQALKSYKEALVIYQQTLGEDHPDVAICFGNMGNIYHDQKKCLKALECLRAALTIWQKSLPTDHHHLGSIHNNIANVYYSLGQYDRALQHYNESLKIKSRSLPHKHPSTASTLKNLGNIYENMDQYQRTLVYLEQAADIYYHTLPPMHSYFVGIKKDIKRVSSQIRGNAIHTAIHE